MTRKERQILERMYKHIETVSVTGATYTHKGGRMVREPGPGDEPGALDRLLKPGSDYRAGWEACRISVYAWLRELGFPTGGR